MVSTLSTGGATFDLCGIYHSNSGSGSWRMRFHPADHSHSLALTATSHFHGGHRDRQSLGATDSGPLSGSQARQSLNKSISNGSSIRGLLEVASFRPGNAFEAEPELFSPPVF